MKQTDQNDLSMWKTVRDMLNAQDSLWNGHAAFTRAVSELMDGINEAEDVLKVQAEGTESTTANRNQAEKEAIDLVVKLGDFTKAYALENKLHGLAVTTTVTAHELKHLPMNARAERMQHIYDAACGVKDQIVEYGADDALLTATITAIERYKKLQNSPRVQTSNRSSKTKSIPDIKARMQEVLERLDKMIKNFELPAPGLVKQYRVARKVVNLGIRHDGDKGKDNTPPAQS